MSKLTIHDIAKMANVSTATVSFVLNGKAGICDETRRRVQAIIDETGYKPNVHTRRLTLKKSFTVHVVMRQYSYNLFNLFATEVLLGIFGEARKLGYNIVFTSVGPDQESLKSSFDYVLDTVRTKDVDGVIFIQAAEPSVIAALQKEQFPFLCVDSHVKKDGSIPLLEVDCFDASYQATTRLIEMGHRDIGFIGSDDSKEYYYRTFGGYAAALKDAGLVCRPEWIQYGAEAERPTPACMKNILACPHRPTAVFCAGDNFALEAMRQTKRAGLRIPQDISFFSMDDVVVSAFVEPALSTMSVDKTLMGRNAMRILYALMNHQPCQMVNLMKTRAIERETVRDLRREQENPPSSGSREEP